MDFGRAFSYIFEDQDWLKKVGVAALVFFIPILGQITVLGWSLEITRRVIRGESDLLPDWSDFSGYLMRGLKGFVISLAYALPVILLSFCNGLFTGVLANPDVVGYDMAQTMATVISITSICFACFNLIYNLAMSLVLPAAYGLFVDTNELGAAFRIGDVIGLVRAAPGPYLMTLLGSIVAGLIAGLGIIACVIGVVFTAAIAMAITGNLYGQAYNQSKAAAPVM